MAERKTPIRQTIFEQQTWPLGSMFVKMRTRRDAALVAEMTGARQVFRSDDGEPTVFVHFVDGFERHRDSVESVSNLFKLFDASGVSLPTGWIIKGFKYEVEWPSDDGVVRSHFGARRFAYNWGLGLVIAQLDARRTDPDAEMTAWDLASLRKRWNSVKDDVASWWTQNSKEAYAAGLDDLVTALSNWSSSKRGDRKGRPVGFPRFKSKVKDRNRVTFTTGAMRFSNDRRTIVLPVIGALRSKENTRNLHRRLVKGDARVLSMTLSEQWGRLFVSATVVVRHAPTKVSKPDVRAGVDLGLRTLATIATSDGDVIEVPNPTPLRDSIQQRRSVSRQMSRRIPGSRGHTQAKAKLATLDRKCVNQRRQAHHTLTSMLASTYGEIVIEDLDIAAMKKSMGRRAFRRSVSDAALGLFRPMLDYKTSDRQTTLVVADRWFASSQIHHGCGCRLHAPQRLAKQLVCAATGEFVDRDINAALNLRDWPESNASCRSVGATVPFGSGSLRTAVDGSEGSRETAPLMRACKSATSVAAQPNEAKTERNPERGAT